jgi:hypothetical protein
MPHSSRAEHSQDLKNAVAWDVTPSVSCENRRFTRMYPLHHQGGKNQRIRNNVSSDKLLVTANVVRSSLTLSILIMEAILSFETLNITYLKLYPSLLWSASDCPSNSCHQCATIPAFATELGV